MERLAFANAYAGASNEPAITLAARLAALAPPGLRTTFFTTGGAESNDTAIKTARFYWQPAGPAGEDQGALPPQRLPRRDHGGHGRHRPARLPPPLRAPAGGLPPRPGDGRRRPGSGHPRGRARRRSRPTSPSRCRAPAASTARRRTTSPGCAELCDRYDILFIADEVITGFGRTGTFWGLQQWGVAPDILSFAKGITSGYLPLGGVIFSDAIRDVLFAPAAGGEVDARLHLLRPPHLLRRRPRQPGHHRARGAGGARRPAGRAARRSAWPPWATCPTCRTPAGWG